MSRYRDWGSGFYEDAYANPPKNPLAGLEEVNSASGLGQNDTISPEALKASCKTIVKLSQEGSTYYSSIRDRSSAGTERQVPVRDKVESWVTQGAQHEHSFDEEPSSSGLRRPNTSNPKLAPTPEDAIIAELRKYPVPEGQVKLLVNNVPPSTTKQCLREMLDNSFQQVYSLEHYESQMIAITSAEGSAEFTSVYDGTVLDNMFPTPLVIYVID